MYGPRGVRAWLAAVTTANEGALPRLVQALVLALLWPALAVAEGRCGAGLSTNAGPIHPSLPTGGPVSASELGVGDGPPARPFGVVGRPSRRPATTGGVESAAQTSANLTWADPGRHGSLDDDHGGAPTAATPLVLGTSILGQIDSELDEDYFRIEVPRPLDLGVFTTSHGVVRHRVVDAAGVEVEGRWQWPYSAQPTFVAGVDPGVYYVAVSGDPGAHQYAVGAVVESPVDIADGRLRGIVEERLRKSPGATIWATEMAAFWQIRASDAGISNLSGLEAAICLDRLYLGGNDIVDLAPLAAMRWLRELDLFDNAITDVSPLAGLARLVWLHLGSNRVEDVSPLARLAGLAWLSLSDNLLVDVTPLASLHALESLDLGGNHVSDIAALVELPDLQWLELRNNPLSAASTDDDIPRLESQGVFVVSLDDEHGDGAATATRLALGGRQRGVIRPHHDRDQFRLDVDEATAVHIFSTGVGATMARLFDSDGVELERGNVDGAEANFLIRARLQPGTYYLTVGAFEDGVHYTVHAAVDATIADIPDWALRRTVEDALHKSRGAPISSAEMATLTALRIDHGSVGDLTGLEWATRLVWLELSLDESGLPPLEHLHRMQVLILRAYRLTDLSGLGALAQLRHLELESHALSDISPLRHLVELRTLSLRAPVTDITPLADLAGLTALEVRSDGVTDLSALSQLRNLKWLRISGTRLDEPSRLAHLPALRARGTVVVMLAVPLPDRRETAVPVRLGESRHGECCRETQYFRLDLADRTHAAIVLKGLMNVTVRLLDGNGGAALREVEWDGNKVAEGPYLVLRQWLDAGRYYVELSGSRGRAFSIAAVEVADVRIPDEALGEAVRFELGKPADQELTSADLAALWRVEAPDAGIRDLAGLEFAVALGRLNAPRNQIRELAPLAGLQRLEVLYLSDNRISDLSPLSGLTGLTRLSLSGNGLSDVSDLGALAGLTILRLDRNRIVDVTPLAGMPMLEELDLSDNRISDVSPLADLTRLTRLALGGNRIRDISRLEHLARVFHLDLRGNPLDERSLALARDFVDRRADVLLRDEHGDSLAGAAHLPVDDHVLAWMDTSYDRDVYRLTVRRTWNALLYSRHLGGLAGRLRDSSGTEMAYGNRDGAAYGFELRLRLEPGLYYLEVTHPRGETGNYRVEALTWIDFPDPRLLEAVKRTVTWSGREAVTTADMPRMTWLVAPGAGITDLRGLEFAVGLRWLDVSDNALRDVTSLADLTRLQVLDLSANRLDDLAPLEGLRELERLRLADNPVSDVAPVAELPCLLDLDLRRTRLDRESMRTLVPALERRGVVVALVDDHGDRAADASRIRLGETQRSRLDQNYDIDYFRLELARAADVALFTTGELRPYGRLHGVSGSYVAADVRRGSRNNFLIRSRLDPGTYFLEVRGTGGHPYDSATLGEYVLRVVEDVPVEVADTALHAAIARVLGKPPPAPLLLSDVGVMRQLWSADPIVTDLSGLELAHSLETLQLPGDGVTDLQPLVGLEYLRLVDVRGNPLSPRSVDTHIPALERSGAVVVLGDDHGSAPPVATLLPLGGSARGIVYPPWEKDYFRLELPSAGRVSLFTLGEDDTFGRLFDEMGQELATDRGGGRGLNFSIDVPLTPGVYYLEVGIPYGVPVLFSRYVVHAQARIDFPLPSVSGVHAELEGTRLVVGWDPLSDFLITGYQVRVVPVGGGDALTCRTGLDHRRCVFDGLTAGAQYRVTVQALTERGPGSTLSTVSEVLPSPRTMWRGWRMELLRQAAQGESSANGAAAEIE